MKKIQFITFLLVFTGINTIALHSNSITVNSGKEWLISGILIDNGKFPINVSSSPSISWQLTSNLRNQQQSAYQIIVGSSSGINERDTTIVWDSKKISSPVTYGISIPNGKLESDKDYWIKVISWNKDNLQAQAFSKFSTALLSDKEWKAKWIGYQSEANLQAGDDSAVYSRSQYLRKNVNLKKKIARARIFVSGLGVFELSINGKKVGDHILSPAKTRYPDRVIYEVFDVKDILKTGKNTIGIELGNGWFNSKKKYHDWRMPWYGLPRAIIQLHLEYTDKSKAIIVTDNSWKASFSPIIDNCIYDGEKYDARLEQKGWNTPEFNDRKWKYAVVMNNPTQRLQTTSMPPERVTVILKPVWEHPNKKGNTTFNFGQNFSGFVRIKIKGTRGTTVTLTHAENISPDSSLNKLTNRKAQNTDVYILKGEGIEEFTPKFTFHGFQYADVAIRGNAELLSIEGLVVHNDVDKIGILETDNELINKIHHAAIWSQKSNLHGLPLDCPQRDERLGWLADGYVTADAAMHNFNMAGLYSKWLDDIRYHQKQDGALPHISPTFNLTNAINWSSGYIIMVMETYRNYGDKKILQTHYPAMRKHIEYLTASSKNKFILAPDRYGDWGNPAQDKANQALAGWKRGYPESSTTAMFSYCTQLLSEAAQILSLKEDHIYYGALKSKIDSAYNESFFDSSTATYKGPEYHYQYLHAVPLSFNIAPKESRKQVLQNLINDISLNRKGHLYAGIIGTRFIPEILSKNGYNQLVYDFINIKGYPGWDFLLQGRNTFPEWWDGNGSHNHVMFGGIDSWFYRFLAGIQNDSYGYEHITIKPFIPSSGLNYINASIKTIKGEISSCWRRNNDQVILQVVIPANTSAHIELPKEAKDISLDGESIKNANFGLGSGDYKIIFSFKER